MKAPRPFDPADRCLLVFSKPAVPGRDKTRLIGELSAQQAAELHEAFLRDLTDRLRPGRFRIEVCWALEAGEEAPSFPLPARRQEGDDLGERLFRALSNLGAEYRMIGAIGSDHPELPASLVEEAFDKLESGADVVLGPTVDGGYYLIAMRAERSRRELFEAIPWSTSGVLAATLARCDELGLKVALTEQAADIDTPEDLESLRERLRRSTDDRCPRTRRLLRSWYGAQETERQGEDYEDPGS